jgi:hypothetical protein
LEDLNKELLLKAGYRDLSTMMEQKATVSSIEEVKQ